MLTPKFTEAVDYARAHHTGDLRQGMTMPYLAHLLAVSALVLEDGGDETAAMAALLHNVVKDGGGAGARQHRRALRQASRRAAVIRPPPARKTGHVALSPRTLTI